MFGWEFPPHVSGGLGVASEGLVRGLLAVGSEVVLVLPHDVASVPGGPLRIVDSETSASSRAGTEDGRRLLLRLRRISSPLKPYMTPATYPAETVPPAGRRRRARPSRGARTLYGPDLAAEVVRYAGAARSIARRERFDVIHAHDWLTFLAGIEARRVSGRPLAVHVHATEFDRSGGDGDAFVHGVERLGTTTADRVIAVSRYTARQVEDGYGVDAGRIRVVHNAIDARVTPAASGGAAGPMVLFAGRVTGQKGPDRFVEAAALVAREIPEARFVVAGDGDRLPAMRDHVARKGLADRFDFTGFLSTPELERLYARADVYVMPSVSEPFGLTALEALRHATPVIVAKDAGVSEVVQNVLRADVDDPKDLASRILSVLLFPPLSRELGRGGRAEVRRLSWAAAAGECLSVYREMLEAAPA
jgi:glycosyltransferase involved in cell wall biosynthesis